MVAMMMMMMMMMIMVQGVESLIVDPPSELAFCTNKLKLASNPGTPRGHKHTSGGRELDTPREAL